MKVSAIIPVLNEERPIVELLASLFLQSRPPDEIVITDGGSTDKTREHINDFQSKTKRNLAVPVYLVTHFGAYPGKGRNLAINEAQHDVIAFVDAGVRINHQWLESLLASLEADPSVDVVFGHYEPVRDTFFTKCAAMAYVKPPEWRGYSTWGTPPEPLSPLGPLKIRTHAIFCSAMRKKVWEEIGGFPNYRAAEDLIFIEKVLAGPYQVVYTDKAVAHLELRPTWRSTVKRFSEYSRHNLRAGRARHWHLPLLKIYGTMVALLALSIAHNPLWLMGIIVGGFYRVFKRTGCNSFITILTVAGILLSIDVATFHGWLTWVFVDRCKRGEGRW